MPAVDPARLRQQIEQLAARAAEPDRLSAGVLELLDFYRDRTRRPTQAARAADPGRQPHDVPKPVVRSLVRGLDEMLAADPPARFQLADRLWLSAPAEARTVAACLVGGVSDEQALEWAAAHARASEGRPVLSLLAECSLAGVQAERPGRLLESADGWIRSADQRLRTLGYLAAAQLAGDEGFADLPAVFHLVENAVWDAGGFPQPALQRLVETLARRSPPEAARLLTDQLGRAIPAVEDLVRLTLPAFPAPQRQRLERSLSALRRAGIIRPSR